MERLTSNVHRRCSLSLETSEMHHNAAVTDLGSHMQRAINSDALKIYKQPTIATHNKVHAIIRIHVSLVSVTIGALSLASNMSE